MNKTTPGLAILNVGAGDTKLSFDPKNPAECIRAARIVRDMLRRGYALLVQVDTKNGEPVYQRARDFDETKCEYVIADFDPMQAEPTQPLPPTALPPEGGKPRTGLNDGTALSGQEAHDEQGSEASSAEATERAAKKPKGQRGRSRGATRRLPAATTPAVAVARSAGG